MRPIIDSTEFGSITIGKTVSEHDVIIRLDGQVKKRKEYNIPVLLILNRDPKNDPIYLFIILISNTGPALCPG